MRDKPLFTPGPLTTSPTVKAAMLRDLGSRDETFLSIVASIRDRLLALAGMSREAGFEAVIMQGSGTFGIESVISSVIPRAGRAKLAVAINGAYGERMAEMARIHGIPCVSWVWPEDEPIDPHGLRDKLSAEPGVTHLAFVHCETTTGVLNPAADIARIGAGSGCVTIMDAMSAFGAIPTDLGASPVDYLISSANKCIEGVPGFSFVLCRRAALMAVTEPARSMSLDLKAQWSRLARDGQFRFTPPTHALLAFHQALTELDAEGGVEGRLARYQRLHEALVQGAAQMGLETYLDPSVQSPIITTFLHPSDPAFVFGDFYEGLSQRGHVIYPGKLTRGPSFRIGTIGHLSDADVQNLLLAMRETLEEMGVEVPR